MSRFGERFRSVEVPRISARSVKDKRRISLFS